MSNKIIQPKIPITLLLLAISTLYIQEVKAEFDCHYIKEKNYCKSVYDCYWEKSKCKGTIKYSVNYDYIFPGSKSKEEDGSYDHPFKTLDKALKSVEPGYDRDFYCINMRDQVFNVSKKYIVNSSEITFWPFSEVEPIRIHLIPDEDIDEPILKLIDESILTFIGA